MDATAKEVAASPSDYRTVANTEEKKHRIILNFRAAKALSACKRPRQSKPSPPHSRNGESVSAKVQKLQLQDPPVRRLLHSETRTSFRLPSFDHGHIDLSPSDECVVKLDEGFSPIRTRVPLLEMSTNSILTNSALERSDCSIVVGGSDCFPPVTKTLGCSVNTCVPVSPLTSNLDDEFGDSFLREVDEICNRSSDEKITRSMTLETDLHLSSRIKLCDGNAGIEVNKMVGDGKCADLFFENYREEKQILIDDSTSSAPRAYLDYWEKLNDRQREAACSDINTPLMIMAGPGSGKTSTMVGRVLMLLNEGISPSNILAMTFTTAAAYEMRGRIGAVVGKTLAKELPISTFHSFSLQLCRSHAEKLGRTAEFLIYGHGQQRRAIIEAFRLYDDQKKDEENHEKLQSSPTIESFKERSKKWEKFVTQAKASGKSHDDYRKNGDELGGTILANYNNILKSCNALDYHDFIIFSVKLLTDFQEVFMECQSLWKAIVVDEFQDTSSMQYKLLRLLASHNRITVIGDDDQSIFSFNGADICAFDSFRGDFQIYTEVRLTINYRSTRFIVEAASSLIQRNSKRCQSNSAVTYNSCGNKITVKECHNDAAECAFVVDKIMQITSCTSSSKISFGDIAILYRKQVTGKVFQQAFRERKIPFNVHGVAFYRKKVIKAILALLRTTLPKCSDVMARQAFKALLPVEKEEKKKFVEYIDKISIARKCSFLAAANDIFRAKVSGTFKRSQLSQGRKVLSTLDMLSKLVQRERSITTVVTSAASVLPHQNLLEKRAVVDMADGKYLNEEHDVRSVLQYLLDDVSEFLSAHFSNKNAEKSSSDDNGCSDVLVEFLNYSSTKEAANFQLRKCENTNSITLTTIHQSKGLEWDTVFIVKVNESEIPLLHEFNGVINSGSTLEEERRLLYVAITRARKKLYILYVLMDSNWQFLQPSRFLKEIPNHLVEVSDDITKVQSDGVFLDSPNKISSIYPDRSRSKSLIMVTEKDSSSKDCEVLPDHSNSDEFSEPFTGNSFLKRFSVENRSIVSLVFNQWAKTPAFQNPKRLLDKVGFVIDERLRNKGNKNKDLLRELKSSLGCEEAFQYAEHILRWQKLPAETRALLTRAKQEHFQKQNIEKAQGSSEATAKQISYLQSLGCTVVPTSRLHASKLIEQYKAL